MSANADSQITVSASNGNVIITFTTPKTIQTLVMSHPELKKGDAYTITVNGQKMGDVTVK